MISLFILFYITSGNNTAVLQPPPEQTLQSELAAVYFYTAKQYTDQCWPLIDIFIYFKMLSSYSFVHYLQYTQHCLQHM